MRIFLILLRVCLLLFSFVCAGGVGVIGYFTSPYFSEGQEARRALAAKQTLLRTLAPGNPFRQDLEKEKQKGAFEQAQQRFRSWPFAFAGVGLVLLAGLFAVLGYTTSAAVVMLLAGLGPAVFLYLGDAWKPLLLLSPIPLFALGSLFVSFLAFVTRPKEDAEQDAEAEDKPKGKLAREEEEEEAPAQRKKQEDEEETLVEPGSNLLDDLEEEPPARPAGKRKIDFEEEEETPARPAPKGKRK